jgi:hypothetical protein
MNAVMWFRESGGFRGPFLVQVPRKDVDMPSVENLYTTEQKLFGFRFPWSNHFS